MALWEYKVITSGKGGFATPALLEKFLNDLGRDEWEIVHFQTAAENFLAFTGLARRSTQRDWTLQDAAAAAAKAEAEKLRAEFEAKFKAAASTAPGAPVEERAPSFLEEKLAPDDGFRKPVDTSHDDDPDAQEEDKADEWDKLAAAEEDDLPTFFEAIKPHMRRNQRGPGMSVGVDYLAKKWDQTEDDLKGALVECGFVMPADEDSKAEYVEYDGDLYWLNINRRGELWINTKEKPRPVFRPVKAARIEIETPPAKEAGGAKESGDRKPDTGDANPETGGRKSEMDDSKPENGGRRSEGGDRKPDTSGPGPGVAGEGQAPSGKPATALPQGTALLDKIRPHMRRNRRGPGGSGSTSFLSRALRTNEADLKAAFAGLGLTIPATAADKPVYAEIGNELWWLNLDSRGGLWINGREKKEGETAAAAKDAATQDAAAEQRLETVPGSAAPDAVPAPEIVPAIPSGVDLAPPGGNEPAATSSPPGSPTGEAPAVPSPAAESAAGISAPAESRMETTSEAASVAEPTSPGNPVLAAVRLLMKETKTGAIAAKVDRLAEELGKPAEELLSSLVGAGLRVPEKPREKPQFVPHAGEILWLNKNAKGELWLNAKASKYADKEADPEESESSSEGGEGDSAEAEKKPRRASRPRGKKAGEEKVET